MRQVCIRVQLVSKGQRADAVNESSARQRAEGAAKSRAPKVRGNAAAASGRKVSARRKVRDDTGTQGCAGYLLVVRGGGLANSKVIPGYALARLAAHHGHKHWQHMKSWAHEVMST